MDCLNESRGIMQRGVEDPGGVDPATCHNPRDREYDKDDITGFLNSTNRALGHKTNK